MQFEEVEGGHDTRRRMVRFVETRFDALGWEFTEEDQFLSARHSRSWAVSRRVAHGSRLS